MIPFLVIYDVSVFQSKLVVSKKNKMGKTESKNKRQLNWTQLTVERVKDSAFAKHADFLLFQVAVSNYPASAKFRLLHSPLLCLLFIVQTST